MSNNNSAGTGIGFCGLLTLVFIVLKLVGVIDWSWVWVLSPIWIPTVLLCIIMIVLIIITGRGK